MLNEIYAEGISHDGYVTIFRHPGATSEQLKEYVNVVIKRKPHINVKTIQNLQTIINRTKKYHPQLNSLFHHHSPATINQD